ncbi:MAG TPA: cation:proton antiporter [Kineosporiaceae bacterium]
MSAAAVSVFAVSVVAFVALSRWIDRRRISAPMVFTAVGGILAVVDVDAPLTASDLQALAETTLALILFHDAAQVRPAQLRRDAGLSARLLLIGLPLTILLGFATGRLLMPTGSGWLILFLASALAPTDAGLGAPTVLNPAVPARVRRVLDVESGLNDGLATPVVLLAVTAMGMSEPLLEGPALTAFRELALGVVIGILAGAGVGKALAVTSRSALASGPLVPIGVLMIPLLAYYASTAAGGNGFVSAFLSGTAFAATQQLASGASIPAKAEGTTIRLTDDLSTLLGYAVWMVFGIESLPHLWGSLTWQAVVFAVLSLTVLRMVPVALALLGARLRAPSVLFIGWFGPRGLASVIFVLIVVQSAPPQTGLSAVIATIELTVLFSVVLHGVTAGPWAARYGAWARRTRAAVETQA